MKCDVVDSKLRFNCVSTRPKAGQMVRLFSGYYRRRDKALLGFRAVRENDPLLPDAGTWRNNHVYEGIIDAPRASGTLMG